MYTEEPKKTINWGEIVKKGLMVIIVILLLIIIVWLFTSRNHTVNVDYDKHPKKQTILKDDTYSEKFIKNYRYFHDTSKEYFLISELPDNNESIRYTLQQLIDKNLIIPFDYTSKENCDSEASYVLVTNTNGKYEMTTTLVCGKEIAITKEELGCNQLCEQKNNNKCETPIKEKENKHEVTKYLHRQPYSDSKTIYECPDGYNKVGSGNNTKCILKDTKTTTPSKLTSYSCDKGYTLVQENDNIVCTNDKKDSITPTITYKYECPKGYKSYGINENMKCEKIKEDNVIHKTFSKCNNGYKLVDGKCKKTDYTYTNPNSKITYKCNEGDQWNDNKCINTKYEEPLINTTHGCKNGDQWNGKKCVNTESIPADTKTIKTCQKGVLKGNQCVNTEYKEPSISTTYGCKNGDQWNGNKCVNTKYTDAISTTTSYCKNGTSINNKCMINTGIKPITKYYCVKGELTSNNRCRIHPLSPYYLKETVYKGKIYNGCEYSGISKNACNPNNDCITTYYMYYCPVTTYIDVGKASLKTTCSKGYVYGNTCVIYENQSTKTTYSCKEGTLKDNKCVITKYYNPSYQYINHCNNGVLKGNQCIITHEYDRIPSHTSYCKEGTLKNNKCVITREYDRISTITYNCPDGSKPNNDNKCIMEKVSYLAPTIINKYECRNGYTLNKKNNTCQKLISKKAQKSKIYNCADDDYELLNNSCVLKSSTLKPIEINSYKCEIGYEQIGLGKDSVCVKYYVEKVDPLKHTTEGTIRFRYRWSEKSSLPGWEYTGKSKTIEVDSN